MGFRYELRLIYIRKRDAVTLCREIRQHGAPGTAIVTDEWAAYRRIPTLRDNNGASLNYTHLTVNHRNNFVNPVTGPHAIHRAGVWAGEAPAAGKHAQLVRPQRQDGSRKSGGRSTYANIFGLVLVAIGEWARKVQGPLPPAAESDRETLQASIKVQPWCRNLAPAGVNTDA